MLDVEEPSKYLLSVYSPGPFNTSRSLFLVDTLAYDPDSHQYSGRRDDGEVVVSFHDSYTYMLVNKDLYEVISMDEAKRMMKQEEGGDFEDAGPASSDPDRLGPISHL
jgi:hypothetical protein